MTRKVCIYCTQEGHRSHACTQPRGPYRMAPIAAGNPHQQYSAEKAAWLRSNPEASADQIEDAAQRIAERLGI